MNKHCLKFLIVKFVIYKKTNFAQVLRQFSIGNQNIEGFNKFYFHFKKKPNLYKLFYA